ncbi:GNAT family N-acetyltransferase [Streptomyces sp. NPDC051020]|uniref:GNAT family N-acetyltransferase n=1 Tax=Streptomyces sp. NPDC051020 TaxID=3155409 RepID=UPI003433C3F5
MPDELTLRRAAPDDTDAVHALVHSAYAKWVPVIGRPPKPMTVDYAWAITAHRIDLLHQGGELVGLIELIVEDDGLLLIENVAVSPSSQGKGIGRRLMGHAEHVAAEGGMGRLRLYTNEQFTENIRLYRRLGYRIDGEEPFGGGKIVHMSKDLTSHP